MAIAADKVRMFPDPLAMLRDYKAGGKRAGDGGRVSGPGQVGVRRQTARRASTPARPAEGTKEPANIVVVADTDLLDDRNWLARPEHVRPAGHGAGRRQRRSSSPTRWTISSAAMR